MRAGCLLVAEVPEALACSLRVSSRARDGVPALGDARFFLLLHLHLKEAVPFPESWAHRALGDGHWTEEPSEIWDSWRLRIGFAEMLELHHHLKKGRGGVDFR